MKRRLNTLWALALCALACLTLLTTAALAAETPITGSGLTVATHNGEAALYTEGDGFTLGTGEYTVSGAWSGDWRAGKTAVLTVPDGKTAGVTLSGVNIDVYQKGSICAFAVAPGGTANLKLSEANSLRSIEARFAPAPAWENPFTDVAEDDWFYDHVAYVQSRGLMVGTAEDAFDPDAAVPRAALVTTLYRLTGAPQGVGEGSPFTDIPDGAWYSAAVAWAVDAGVTQGVGGGRFDPDGLVTREQLFTLLHRFAQYQKRDVSAGEDTNILSYTDAFDLAEWSIPAFQWACATGLAEGTGDGRLDPQGTATRAQLAAALERYMEL